MAEPQIVYGRLLVTLDDGKNNVGRIAQHLCHDEARLRIPKVPEVIEPGEDPQPVPEFEYYDHIVFAQEMSGEVEIDDVSYVGMTIDAVLAVIPDD